MFLLFPSLKMEKGFHPRHYARKQKGNAVFFKVFCILDVQVTGAAWDLLCSATPPGPGSCFGCKAPSGICRRMPRPICGQEPSPGFTPRHPSGVLVLIALLVLEQEDAVHIQGSVLGPDLEPRDQFLLQSHLAVVAAICSGRVRAPGHRPHSPTRAGGGGPGQSPTAPGGCFWLHECPSSMLMLCAYWMGWPLRHRAAVLL